MTATAPTHLVTSHGADFFGEDRHSLQVLQQIGPWVTGWGDTREAGQLLVGLLDTAGTEAHTIPAEQAADFAYLLLHAVHNTYFPKKAAKTARLLAEAAARAAADGEPWTWTPATGTDH
jgi:hypothetical protein